MKSEKLKVKSREVEMWRYSESSSYYQACSPLFYFSLLTPDHFKPNPSPSLLFRFGINNQHHQFIKAG